MTDEEILEKLRRILREQAFFLDYESDIVQPHHKLHEDLNASETDLVFLVMAVEEEFGIEVLIEETAKLITVGDLVELIKERGA